MKNIQIAVVALLLSIAATGSALAQKGVTLKVNITGLESRAGVIHAALCNDAAQFPQGPAVQESSIKIKKKGKVVLKFKNVAPGTYAIRMYQDLDENQKMDFNGQMPAEPFGFSNMKALFGPPGYEQCKFEVKENTTLDMKMISM